MGSGLNGFSALAMASLPNGDLVAGGSFTLALGNNIARWDGANWLTVAAGTDNMVRCLATLPDGVLVAGGNFATAGGGFANHFARLTTTCPATAATYGAGCTGSGGLNVLTNTTLPWIGSTFVAVATGVPANAFALGVIGLGTTSLALSTFVPSPAGCTLLVSPDLLDLHLPTAGSVQTRIAIPNTAALAGQVIREQVAPVELDALGNITAITSTNALTLTIGAF